jgi:lactate permease
MELQVFFALIPILSIATTKISPLHLLTLQTIGASIGNMICIVNMIAACAVVGINNKERIILRNTFLPALLIALVAFLADTISIQLS